MAHYAMLDENNIVINVITGIDEDEIVNDVTDWEAFYSEMHGCRVLRTSYNTYQGEHRHGGTPFRGNYAAIGYSYSDELDAFIPPQPEPDWVLNTTTFTWGSPTPIPPPSESVE